MLSEIAPPKHSRDVKLALSCLGGSKTKDFARHQAARLELRYCYKWCILYSTHIDVSDLLYALQSASDVVGQSKTRHHREVDNTTCAHRER